jgi:FkbM family methyltransferase
MRKFVNKFLLPLGYELRRIERFNRLLDELWQSPGGVKFVQVGANDGVRFDGLYAKVTQHPCAGLVIEPLPDMFERLKMNYAGYPAIVPVKIAIHASARSMDLYRVAPGAIPPLPDWAAGIASFDRGHLTGHGIPVEHIVAEPVACVPLMELLESTRCLDANVLQIDTEGYDAEIIRMIDFARFRPRLIKYEHKNLTSSAAHDAETSLRAAGYRVNKEQQDTIAWHRVQPG